MPEEKLVNIKIDDKEYQVQAGSTILSACKKAGIDIPSLCYLEGISEEAACSICVVEVKGAKTLIRSCVTRVTENMEIFTATPRVQKARKLNLELILASHSLDCDACEKEDNCLLEEIAGKFGIKQSRFLVRDKPSLKRQGIPWQSNPFIRFDPDKCILCGRCVNACKNQAVLEAISFAMRGHREKVSTPFAMPLENTNCQFCAECAQVCPVSALMEKTRQNKGKIKDFTTTDTICAYCGVGCNLRVYKDKNNNLVMTEGIEDKEVNKGRLCVKGRFGFEYTNSTQRLTTPLIKEKGKFRKATWDEALKYTARRLKEIKEKYGPDAIGVLGSSRCTNEDNYVLQKFGRAVIGTNNVDNCARLCHSSTVAGLGLAFGAGAATNSLEDINDSDLIFIIGSNMSETHPVIAQIVKGYIKNNNQKLIVCDPRCVGMAKCGDIFIQHYPGTDVALLNGIMKLILDKGMENKEFIQAHTEGFAEFKKIVVGYDVQKVVKITGVEKEKIEQAAELIARSRAMMIFFTMGITQHTTGVDNVLSVANLALLTANIGRRGAGVMPLRGQANVQGACDMGVLPDVLPGYQKISDGQAREKFEKIWKVKLPDKAGLCVTEFTDQAIKGNLKAIYSMGENPMMSEPDIQHVKKGLQSLEFLAVQDIFLSATAELAHVVFPAAGAYEKDGTFVNTERRVQLLRKACAKPKGARFDWEIVRDLSRAMGSEMNYENTSGIMDEIAGLVPAYSGINHQRLEQKGIQWPCPDKAHPGTVFLHKDGQFKRSNAKALFSAIEYKPAKETADSGYPFILTTGRILYHYHSGNETRRVKVLNKFVPRNYAEINKDDAQRLKITDKEKIKVSTRRGSIVLEARVSDQPKQGVIFISFHFKEAAANLLTNPVFDPISKIPEYKVAACKIEKTVIPPTKVEWVTRVL